MTHTTTNQELARLCHEAYARAHDGEALTTDTPHADFEAFFLMTAIFAKEYREAIEDGNSALAVHVGDLLKDLRRDGAFAVLSGMAGEEK